MAKRPWHPAALLVVLCAAAFVVGIVLAALWYTARPEPVVPSIDPIAAP